MHKTSIKQFKRKLITIFFLICLVSTDIVFAAGIIISASVDKNQITLEDTIELSIKITGVRNPKIPVLPTLSDFIIRSAGTQSSTQIFNSNVQTTTIYKYLLIPKNEGTFIIDPIKHIRPILLTTFALSLLMQYMLSLAQVRISLLQLYYKNKPIYK